MVGNDIDALENIQRKNYVKAINKYNRNRRKEAEKAAGK
jgi:DNA polymerase I-like protein with 3'-5' exonuclease and polymerase domains